jgi:hypothetical protein
MRRENCPRETAPHFNWERGILPEKDRLKEFLDRVREYGCFDKLQSRMEACWPRVDARVAAEKNDSWENKMKVMAENFQPGEWKRLRAGVSNRGYHYLGAAKIMAPIGKAFAEAMVKLQRPD